MNPTRYSELANAAGERYQAVLTTFRGMLFAFMAQPFSEARVNELRSNAVEVGRMFMRSEEGLIDDALAETAQASMETADRDLGVRVAQSIPDAYSAFLNQNTEYLLSEVQAQLSRDVEMLARRYREWGLETYLNKVAGSGAPRSASTDKSRFYYRDRVGRLYPSTKFIRTVWRQTLVSVGAEFYVLEAASSGVDEVQVVTPDPHSKWSGFVIGLSDQSSAPAFIDVRDEIFHPNSDATLKPHVPA